MLPGFSNVRTLFRLTASDMLLSVRALSLQCPERRLTRTTVGTVWVLVGGGLLRVRWCRL